MIKQFTIGQPVRPANSHDWAGRVIAVYEAYDGVLYAVQRAFGKVCSYKAEQLAHRKEKPILVLVKSA